MYEYWCILLYPFFFGIESSRQHYSNRGRCSGYIKEEIVSMEMPDAGVNAKLKWFEKGKFLWSHWRMGTFGLGGGDPFA